MRLPRLPLQRVLLLPVLGMPPARLAPTGMMLLDKLLLLADALAVHALQQRLALLDVGDEAVAPVARKVLAHHDAQHLEVLGVRRHRVGRHHPPAHAQLVRERELVVVALVFVAFREGGQAEGDEREALAGLLGHDDEAEGGERVGEVVGGAGEIGLEGLVKWSEMMDEGEKNTP
jgi:hypothetical protein